MSLLDEVLFDRLLDRYEHRFGAAPPIDNATLPEAIDFMRRALAAPEPEVPTMHAGAMAPPAGGPSRGLPGG